MKCEICSKGPQDGVTLYRTNPKGERGTWRCPDCLTSEQAEEIDSEVIRITKIIETNQQEDRV